MDVNEDVRSSFGPRLALVLGAVAMVALPLSSTWPLDAGPPVVEWGGLAAALGAFLLGQRARVAGDRSIGAVWGPRLGGAALLGYALVFILGLST